MESLPPIVRILRAFYANILATLTVSNSVTQTTPFTWTIYQETLPSIPHAESRYPRSRTPTRQKLEQIVSSPRPVDIWLGWLTRTNQFGSAGTRNGRAWFVVCHRNLHYEAMDVQLWNKFSNTIHFTIVHTLQISKSLKNKEKPPQIHIKENSFTQ
jgi:hypothetical protein